LIAELLMNILLWLEKKNCP
jgi:hypothetical protein